MNGETKMGIAMRSSRNNLELTTGAQYCLWAEKNDVNIEHLPPMWDSRSGDAKSRYYHVVDWGRVIINGLPVAQFYVVYKNERGHRQAFAAYPKQRPPLPHPSIRVWVE